MAALNATQLLEQWVLTFNRGDVEAAQKLFAANAVLEEIGTDRKLKKEEIPAVLQGWRAAFPDAAGKITRVIANRNLAAGEITWSGTHKGELMGKPATNQAVTASTVAILTADNGLITYLKHYIDVAGMVKQLEAAPKPA